MSCCIVLTLCFATRVQAREDRSTPRKVSPASVVRDYCKLDFEGARLSSESSDFEKYFALVAWPDEPGWDGAVVIRNFRIVLSGSAQPVSKVTVRYVVLGNMSGARVTASPQHEEGVTFVLKRSGDTWKIEHPLIPPHISVHAAIVALSSLLKGEKDPEQRRRLRAGIAILTRLGQTGDTGAMAGAPAAVSSKHNP